MRLIHVAGTVGVLVLALGLSGAVAQRGEAQPIPISLGLGVNDALGDFDFVVQNSGLEIAWFTRVAARSNDMQLWYVRRDLRTGVLSPAVRITTAEGPLRLLAAENGLHLVVGRKLRHLWLRAGSSTWQELPPLLPAYGGFGSLDCESFDVVADRDALIAVYVRTVRKAGTPATSWPLGVQVVRWSPQGTSKPVVVAEHHRDLAMSQPAPKILLDRGALTLIYAINAVVRDASTAAVQGISGEVLLSTSKDRGATWTNPSRIGRTDGRTGEGTIAELDAAQLNDQLLVFWRTWGLSFIRGSRGKWTDSKPFAAHLSWIGWSDASSLTVACSPEGRGRVYWIDTRYRRDDRTPTNPFAGNPFADHEWANNDVLSLPLQHFNGTSTGEEVPDRLTRDLSYAARARARVAGGTIYVMWSGRAKVGKTVDAFGEPPDLFLRRFPL